MVVAVFFASCLALLTGLSALMVYPAAAPGEGRSAPSDERAAAFAEISGALLDRYARAGEPILAEQAADERALVAPALIEAAPLLPPSPLDPHPDVRAAAPSLPPPPQSAEAGDRWTSEEEETWIRPDPPQSAGATPPAIQRDGDPSAPDLRVFVHFSGRTGAGRERAMRVARALEAQGFSVADIREVGFAVASARVRYFFSADRPGAERLAREARSLLPGDDRRRAVPAQDYTHFRPLPTPGNVELWLASDQPGGAE